VEPKKIQGTILFASWLIPISLTGCGKPTTDTELVRPVRAMKVGELKAIQKREFPGRAKARDEADLSFRIPGQLKLLPVDVGAVVKAGDLIAALDPKDYQAAFDSAQGNLAKAEANLSAMERGARPEEIEQLKAALAEAEASYRQAAAEHERNVTLVKTHVIAQADFDISLARRERTAAQVTKAKEDLNIGQKGARAEDIEAKKAEIRSLEAARANAKNQLDDAILKAPFGGNIAARYVENYRTVQAKQSIVRLLDDSKVEVVVQIPENVISLVPRVKQAVCRFDAFPGREFTGEITKDGSEASQTTRTYPVTVEVTQPDDVRILPGMAAAVRGLPDKADMSEGNGFVIPPSAVLTASDSQQNYVWVSLPFFCTV